MQIVAVAILLKLGSSLHLRSTNNDSVQVKLGSESGKVSSDTTSQASFFDRMYSTASGMYNNLKQRGSSDKEASLTEELKNFKRFIK